MSSRVSSLSAARGFGLVEVMVSVLLLAVGVLGFVGLQTVSIDASSDGLVKSNIITVMRDASDRVRFNPTELDTYRAELIELDEALESTGTATEPTNNCLDRTCTPEEQAELDSFQAATKAYESGFRLQMDTCPGTENNGIMQTECLIGSWGETSPTVGSDADVDCIDDATGTYFRAADCLIMEIQ